MQVDSETAFPRADGGLLGRVLVPPDKSLSHRAALFAGIAEGTSRVRHFLRGEDCLNTLECLQAMGVGVEWKSDNEVLVTGHGLNGLQEPKDVLQAGNSGTTMRLLTGLLASRPFYSVITGDASLRGRPMGRIGEPLTRMGAQIWGRGNGSLAPLAIQGRQLHGIDYHSPVASAQVKSALLLAGLSASGETRVTEPARSRDHTERMFRAMGAEIEVDGLTVSVRGGSRLKALDFTVPGDISSAAFWLVAATLVPNSDVWLEGVGVNPTRTGILDVLWKMGANIEQHNIRDEAGEPVCDLRVRTAKLKGTTIAGDLIPRLVDEIPVLAIAAACAEGMTEIRDARELRVKESDRLRAIVREYGPLGFQAQELPDGLVIAGGTTWRGGSGSSGGDHRIAMSLAVVGLLADGPVEINNTACTRTSYPNFWEHLKQLTHTV